MSYTPHKYESREERGKTWAVCTVCGKTTGILESKAYGDHCPGKDGSDVFRALFPPRPEEPQQ